MTKKSRPIDPYEAQYALDTLIKAEEIKQDKKLMGQVKKEMANRKAALNRVLSPPKGKRGAKAHEKTLY